eukprot:SAG31_NODE_17554_length_666_cov_1.680776_1_plen_119_part_00
MPDQVAAEAIKQKLRGLGNGDASTSGAQRLRETRPAGAVSLRSVTMVEDSPEHGRRLLSTAQEFIPNIEISHSMPSAAGPEPTSQEMDLMEQIHQLQAENAELRQRLQQTSAGCDTGK